MNLNNKNFKPAISICSSIVALVLLNTAQATSMVRGHTNVDLNSLAINTISEPGSTIVWDLASPLSVDVGVDFFDTAEFSEDVTPTILNGPSLRSATTTTSAVDLSSYWGGNMGTSMRLSQLSQGVGAASNVYWGIEVSGRGSIGLALDYDLSFDVVNDTDGIYAQGLSEIIFNIGDQIGLDGSSLVSTGEEIAIARRGNYQLLEPGAQQDSPEIGTLNALWNFDTCTETIVGTNPDGSNIYDTFCTTEQLYINLNMVNTANIIENPAFVASSGSTPGTQNVPEPETLLLMTAGLSLLFFRRKKRCKMRLDTSSMTQ